LEMWPDSLHGMAWSLNIPLTRMVAGDRCIVAIFSAPDAMVKGS
jgi:hypothetical protein